MRGWTGWSQCPCWAAEKGRCGQLTGVSPSHRVCRPNGSSASCGALQELCGHPLARLGWLLILDEPMTMTTSIKQHWHMEELGSCMGEQPEEPLAWGEPSLVASLPLSGFAQSDCGRWCSHLAVCLAQPRCCRPCFDVPCLCQPCQVGLIAKPTFSVASVSSGAKGSPV